MSSYLWKPAGHLTKIFYMICWCLLLFGCCPKIMDFTPQSGEPGDEVDIRGSKFESNSGENTVKFNGVVVQTSDISYASTTQIRAKVPPGATSGPISVRNRYCSGQSSTNFIVFESFWSHDASANTAICTSPREQLNPVIASDYADGAIIAWYDWRGGTPRAYAQRINLRGEILWRQDGVPLCEAMSSQGHPKIAADGAGGAIVAWHDQHGPGNLVDIRAQRMDAAGNLLWTPAGNLICTASGDQEYPEVISDGYGGAIIVWRDWRAGSDNSNIYAQRINSAGVALWTPDGVAVCTAPNHQARPVLVSDNSGGTIIAWYDKRSGYWDIYAQRISASGATQWQSNGVAICTAPGDQLGTAIASDGAGGAIISWEDKRAGSLDSNIYVQRINSAGAFIWATNGVAICTASYHQYNPVATTDGSGGAVIAWVDARGGSGGSDIYAQRISASGAVQWIANGVSVCAAQGRQGWSSAAPLSDKIVGDGGGGAIITWEDGRYPANGIYAQHIDGSGAVQWLADGVAVSTKTDYGMNNPAIVSGAGGAIITFQLSRVGEFTSTDIYAQRVTAQGNL
jgi:hypothetical protein